MTQEEIKANFSQNLIHLRKAKNLTQLQLAEKLNYSDKAISKWEVGSVLPDIETLTHIAEFFGVSVNDLIYKKKRKLLREFYSNHVFMTLAISGLIWFISTIVFFVLDHATTMPRCWLTFIFTLPIHAVILVVLTSLWFKKIFTYLAYSLTLWGIVISVFLGINRADLWFIFIVGLVGQIAITFALQIGRKKVK